MNDDVIAVQYKSHAKHCSIVLKNIKESYM